MAGTFVGWGGRPKGEPTKVDEIRDFANYIRINFIGNNERIV